MPTLHVGGGGDVLPPPEGHYHDPRTPELDDDAAELITKVDIVLEYAQRAQSAICRRDVAGACAALDHINDLLS